MKSSSRSLSLSLSLSLALAVAISGPACTRSKSVRRTPGAALESASASPSAFGPRADLAQSAEESVVLDAASARALPIVDGALLLEKIRKSGHKGVVVNAWASWCDPCREELPMLARVAPKLTALGVPVWLVSVDDPEGYSAAKGVLESLHIELPSYAAAPPLQAFKLAMNPKWPA